MLHLVYRAYGGENKKGRPCYYSKLLALASFIRAYQALPPGSFEAIFLCDGPIPADRLALMERHGELARRANLGLRGSLMAALALPAVRKWAPGDLVWFAEDDYLYQPGALQNLMAAADALQEADYFALYAQVGNHPPSGDRSRAGWVPSGWTGSQPLWVAGHPWRKALATTSTFGGRVGAFLEDRRMMRVASYSGGAWDHATHLMLNGFHPFRLSSLVSDVTQEHGATKRVRRMAASVVRLGFNGYQALRSASGSLPRTMMTADPALITHLETSELAVGTDWEALAEETRHWIASQSLPALESGTDVGSFDGVLEVET